MKNEFCIVNNNTSHLQELTEMVGVHGSFVVIHPEDARTSKRYRAIILSGSSSVNYRDYFVRYPHMKEVIRQGVAPTLGVCLGFELIAHLYGASLQRMNEKVQNVEEIRFSGENVFMTGFMRYPHVYEGHRWIVPSIDKMSNLLPLAESKHGVEIIQVKGTCVFGFQFHPEVAEYNGVKTDGSQLFENFLRGSNII